LPAESIVVADGRQARRVSGVTVAVGPVAGSGGRRSTGGAVTGDAGAAIGSGTPRSGCAGGVAPWGRVAGGVAEATAAGRGPRGVEPDDPTAPSNGAVAVATVEATGGAARPTA
jgi:hypothetical protein